MSHPELIESAKQAIAAVFGDQSVDRATTRESLDELASEVDAMIASLNDE